MWAGVLSSWVFRVEPLEDESLSHLLGRFRRANCLSYGVLAELININKAVEPFCEGEEVENWERPSSRCFPSDWVLGELSRVMQIERASLSDRLMAPSKGEVGLGQWHLQTRLCSACYGQVPIHRMRWQYVDRAVCEEHGCDLLSACPGCGVGFSLPSLWAEGRCDWCWLRFEQMDCLRLRETFQ